MPQQVQQYPQIAPDGPSATSSPLATAAQPQFPPGVKVSQGDQIQIPQQQSIGAQRPPSANTSQQLPPQLQQRSTVSSAFPGSLSDLVVSFENVKQKGLLIQVVLPRGQLFDSCHNSSVTSHDKPRPGAKIARGWLFKCSAAPRYREVSCTNYKSVQLLTLFALRPKYYVPRNPFQTPDYYPQVQNPVLSTSGIFSQLDVETLFYVFYFLPGTYQQ